YASHQHNRISCKSRGDQGTTATPRPAGEHPPKGGSRPRAGHEENGHTNGEPHAIGAPTFDNLPTHAVALLISHNLPAAYRDVLRGLFDAQAPEPPVSLSSYSQVNSLFNSRLIDLATRAVLQHPRTTDAFWLYQVKGTQFTSVGRGG
ncbi:hypothetical protein XENORESO_001263, partial [Xenotaenia resolanae]